VFIRKNVSDREKKNGDPVPKRKGLPAGEPTRKRTIQGRVREGRKVLPVAGRQMILLAREGEMGRSGVPPATAKMKRGWRSDLNL